MRNLSKSNLQEVAVKNLGLDSSAVALDSIEAIACSLRKAAGFLCPCSSKTLVHSVVEPLRGLLDQSEDLNGLVENTLESLISHGDLLELMEFSQEEHFDRNSILYLAPPSFVQRSSGALIILGVLPDHISLLPSDLEEQIEYLNHVRLLPPKEGKQYANQLLGLGFIHLMTNAWLKPPKVESAHECLIRMNCLLEAEQPSGDVLGLQIIDFTYPVRYYRGRWVEPTKQSGRFIGRRAQAYGADLWCYVEVSKGSPVRFFDLPLRNSSWRGCDEAWKIQAAIDWELGTPQQFRIRPGPIGTQILDFFSPVPMWVTKKLEVVGEPILSSGCLFSYRFKNNEVDEEVSFLKEKAWLIEKPDE